MEDLIVTPYDIDTTLGVEEVDEKKGKRKTTVQNLCKKCFRMKNSEICG